MDKLLELAASAARKAGAVILEHYHHGMSIEYKLDKSPFTTADMLAHEIIIDYLKISNIPIVSEEGEYLQINENKYWLIDPLDGTKDFLSKNDEFTVNIALIENHRPVLGVLFAPAIGDLYWGAKHQGSWRIRENISTKLIPKKESIYCRMAISRFHNHPDVETFAFMNNINNLKPIGSALKYGLLAASEIDIFPRLVGSSEWDTAAGQAVLEEAGGQVLNWHTGESLTYGKKGRRNTRILALRSPYTYEKFKLKDYKEELL
jgi:3'(2'), 5'-bisphosphate nucleotidase